MTAIVDLQRILSASVGGALAREVLESSPDLNSATLARRQQALLAMVGQAVVEVTQRLAAAAGYSLVLERHRAGVLFAAPVADLTGDVLTAYDAVVNDRLTTEGREAVLRHVRAQLDAVLKAQADDRSPGQYL
jgi:hypothetical protein